jgi:D-alanine-D-alanine ligase-like ATP-grasp enzyme
LAENFRVLFVGQADFGESYTGQGAGQGLWHNAEHLKPLVEACDSLILNLETPLGGWDSSPPPHGVRKNPKGASSEGLGSALTSLGVTAVNLANDVTLQIESTRFESTLRVLENLDVGCFGAGRNLDEASAPYSLPLPERMGGGMISFNGSVQSSLGDHHQAGLFATQDSGGCAPLTFPYVFPARTDSTPEDTFQVAIPFWGQNGNWRNPQQYELAHRFLNKDYDLVLGHGTDSLQEIHRKRQRWVVYGTGRSRRGSPGRLRHAEANGILPFNLLTVLEVHRQEERRRLTLKLYPIREDGKGQRSPVSSRDFDRLVKVLSARPIRPWRFRNPAQSTGTDNVGHYLALDLGQWPIGRRPERLRTPLESDDPGEWPLRGPSIELEDEVLSLNKQHGATVLSLGAEADGGHTEWLTDSLALISSGSSKFLAKGSVGHESALGSKIVGDKILTSEILTEYGVPTPQTHVVASADDAVEEARTMDCPVVIKPRDARKSKGVSTGLIEDHEIRDAFALAREYSTEIIVQQHVEPAEEMRLMASPHEVAAVNVRVFPHVAGDGVSTIEQLIEDKNLQRTVNPTLRGSPIPVDEATCRQLKRQGLSLDYVPELGQVVTVRNFGGLSVGADIMQNLERSSAQLKQVATSAIDAIPGLGWGGVDLIIERDTGKPYVIEINTSAGHASAAFPTYGQPLNIGSHLWKLRSTATLGGTEPLPQVRSPKLTRKNKRVPRKRDYIRFRSLFKRFLRRNNYTVERKNSEVSVVTSPQGISTWVTHAGMTAADRFVVRVVLKRDDWVFRLLEAAGVSLPSAQRLSGVRQLERFVEERAGEVLVKPTASSWNVASSQVISDIAALDPSLLLGKVWVQERPEGHRVRVLASHKNAWVVTAEHYLSPLNSETITEVCQVAVEAIRAIPELRWATVDILVCSPRVTEDETTGGILVEGLTQQPSYSANEYLVAGSFNRFFTAMISSSGHF